MPTTVRLCTVTHKALTKIPNTVKYPDGSQQLEMYLERLKVAPIRSKWKAALVSNILESYERRQAIVMQYNELTREIQSNTDPEIQAMANEEFAQYKEMLGEIDASLMDQLIAVQEDDSDISSIVMEVAAGVGGDEAVLFAGDLFQMYANFAKHKAWDHRYLGSSQNRSMLIRAADAYETLKYETGVHRVQRVPKTESKGRMHTSAAVVLITPFEQDVDIQINRKDLKIENTRASGPGGQNVNKSESAIRLTHLPTGIVIECQDQRTATRNQEIAIQRLRDRLYDREVKRQQSSTSSMRMEQAGNRGRNEKVRTYNFPRNQVTDHRLGSTAGSVNNLEELLNGGECLDEFIARVRSFQKRQQLKQMLDG